MIEKIIFYILAIVSVSSTIYLFFSKDLFKSFIAMFIIFITTAFIYFHMGLIFLGVFQLIIYAGAIMVLFIVAMNLLPEVEKEVKFNKPSVFSGFLFSTLFLILLGFSLYKILNNLQFDYSKKISFMDVSRNLFNDLPVQIEIISLILFVAIVIAYSLLRSLKDEL